MTPESSHVPLKVLIAASGTGGHLFPALYIAQAIKKQNPEADIRFVGSGRPLEEKIIDEGGYKRYVIPIGGVRRLGLKGVFNWLLQIPRALKIGLSLFKEFSPHIVVGVGGYVSVLPICLAKLSGIPSWIHEAERTPGLANKVLSFIASRISVAYADSNFPRKRRLELTGHPLRPEMKEFSFQPSERRDRKPRLLVLGGSQGAQGIDDAMKEIADKLQEKGIEIFHQCRKENVSLLRDAYNNSGAIATVEAFVRDIARMYQWCDAIVARTGAGTVREISITRRPTICVPLPGAKEQRENAEILERAGNGIIVEEGENFSHRLLTAIDTVLTPGYGENASFDASELNHREAADTIARGIIQLRKIS